MSKAFVTGATGFLGTNLVKELLEQNWEVIVFSLPSESMRNLEGLDVQHTEGDILDYPSLLEAVPRDDDIVIFHVAGDTSMWKRTSDRQFRINVTGTKNVAKAAVARGVKRFVYTSSISAYGYHSIRIDETAPSNALSCKMNYNKTKYLAEEEVHKAIEKGLDAVILNPCNMMGPYDAKGWSTLIKTVAEGRVPGVTMGVGTFSHVRDVAKAHIRAAEAGRTGENYLIGGVEISFRDIYRKIAAVLGKDQCFRVIPAPLYRMAMYFIRLKAFFKGEEPALTYPRYKRLTGHILCDDTKARDELMFNTTSIDEMLQDSCNWLVKAGLIPEVGR